MFFQILTLTDDLQEFLVLIWKEKFLMTYYSCKRELLHIAVQVELLRSKVSKEMDWLPCSWPYTTFLLLGVHKRICLCFKTALPLLWQDMGCCSCSYTSHTYKCMDWNLIQKSYISTTHGALCCPDDVSGDTQEDEIPGGALSLNLLTTQTMVTTGIFPCKEKFPW